MVRETAPKPEEAKVTLTRQTKQLLVAVAAVFAVMFLTWAIVVGVVFNKVSSPRDDCTVTTTDPTAVPSFPPGCLGP